MQPSRVVHPADPRVALYRGVSDPELLQDQGAFIAEGRLVVQRLLTRSRFRVRSVLVTPAALEAMHDLLLASPAEILVVDPDVMNALTTFNMHRGCLALAERAALPGVDELLAGAGPLLVLENVGNPDNVGGAFRNAAAFGAPGIILSPGCTDPLYRKAIRTSMGASLTLPFATATVWPEALDSMRQAGWTTIALTTSAEHYLDDVVRERVGRRVAFVLGHEGHGLSETVLRACEVHACIPMAAGTDSLNVATAAAIALYALRVPFGFRP